MLPAVVDEGEREVEGSVVGAGGHRYLHLRLLPHPHHHRLPPLQQVQELHADRENLFGAPLSVTDKASPLLHTWSLLYQLLILFSRLSELFRRISIVILCMHHVSVVVFSI
eukprot:TRINITY_DN167692_c0_g1_i1.p1 TRINITY_DN167692_c0_g1~~TRINITY_DN167692_c0_g1_i1.p1  ORF type:complete len:111 (-),score=12.32 TRINITY_DN167692_c0_g1_i1:69-401(-)